MDSATRKLLAGAIRTLVSILKTDQEPAKPKPPKPAVTLRQETDLERVQRACAFQREHGGILAHGRMNDYGQMDWKFRQRY